METMVKVGDVFVVDGEKWVVRSIDLEGTSPKNISREPRIDDSKFFIDEDGNEKVRKGRPSKFKPHVVYEALGFEAPDTEVKKGRFAPSMSIEELRENREALEQLINSTVLDDF